MKNIFGSSTIANEVLLLNSFFSFFKKEAKPSGSALSNAQTHFTPSSTQLELEYHTILIH
jgi:hypothetical protein